MAAAAAAKLRRLAHNGIAKHRDEEGSRYHYLGNVLIIPVKVSKINNSQMHDKKRVIYHSIA